MNLTFEEGKQFYDLYAALLAFVNRKLKVSSEEFSDSAEYTSTPPEARVAVRDALFAHRELIDEFVKENPANPLWQIALLPAFLSTQGVRHLLQCLALLTVNHGDLMPVLKQIHRSRFYLSALKEQYPLTHQWLQTALQASPAGQQR